MTESTEKTKSPKISRRTVVKGLGVAAATLAAGGAVKLFTDLVSNSPLSEEATLNLDGKKVKVEFGKAEKPNIERVDWFPDGHTSFLRDDKGIKIFISGGPYGYIVEGQDLQNLGTPREIIRPSRTEDFDRDYAAPGSVIQGKNPDELLMFYHGEYHPQSPSPFPFTAGVGLMYSPDMGNTWEKRGQILKGMDNNEKSNRPSGAGQPSVIVKDGYLYLYYVDWNGEFPDSIHLARSPIEANGAVESWEKFTDGNFSNFGLDGKSTPVIRAKEGDYAAIPAVSWNSFLNKYLAIFESRKGFNISVSDNAVDWSEPQMLLEVQTINNSPKNGQIWNSYPTLWSPDKPNDRETSEKLLLIYSEGKLNQETHSMRTRPIRLS